MSKASGVAGRAAGGGDLAGAFGATIRVSRPEGAGLCLVVTRGADAGGLVAGAGGRVVTRFPGATRCLALVTWAGMESLRAHRAVAVAGPVSIDAERFERFASFAGLTPSPTAPEAAQGG
jgi:hypothetical protein